MKLWQKNSIIFFLILSLSVFFVNVSFSFSFLSAQLFTFSLKIPFLFLFFLTSFKETSTRRRIISLNVYKIKSVLSVDEWMVFVRSWMAYFLYFKMSSYLLLKNITESNLMTLSLVICSLDGKKKSSYYFKISVSLVKVFLAR